MCLWPVKVHKHPAALLPFRFQNGSPWMIRNRGGTGPASPSSACACELQRPRSCTSDPTSTCHSNIAPVLCLVVEKIDHDVECHRAGYSCTQPVIVSLRERRTCTVTSIVCFQTVNFGSKIAYLISRQGASRALPSLSEGGVQAKCCGSSHSNSALHSTCQETPTGKHQTPPCSTFLRAC